MAKDIFRTADVSLLIAVLTAKRELMGVSASVIAAHMGVWEGTVERIENADGGSLKDLKVGELADYAEALGGRIKIELELP